MRAIAFAAMLSACVSGPRAWSTTDFTLEMGVGVGAAVAAERVYWDARTSGQMTSGVEMIALVPAAIALHAVIAHYLPERWRTAWQLGTLSAGLITGVAQ